MIACRSRTSAAARTNDSATKSTPRPSANSRSSRSFFVSDGIGIGTPGRFTPLCDLTSPPTTTRQRARPCSTSWTVRRTRPSSIRMSWPGRSTSPITAGATGSSPFDRVLLADDDELLVLQQDARRRRGRRCGASAPAGRRSARAACRSRPAPRARPARRPRESSCVPCERLRRIASTPASTSSRTRRASTRPARSSRRSSSAGGQLPSPSQ